MDGDNSTSFTKVHFKKLVEKYENIEITMQKLDKTKCGIWFFFFFFFIEMLNKRRGNFDTTTFCSPLIFSIDYNPSTCNIIVLALIMSNLLEANSIRVLASAVAKICHFNK